MREIRGASHPARVFGETASTNFKIVEAVPNADVAERYRALSGILLSRDVYDPLYINGLPEYPEMTQFRTSFVQKLAVECPIEMVTHAYGNYLGTMVFAWRIPDDEGERVGHDQAANRVREQLPVYHTRTQRKEFMERFGLVTGLSKAVLLSMYRFVTGDASAEILTDVQKRLELLFDTADLTLLTDMRVLNGSYGKGFGLFWDACNKYLENIVVPDDRRHGQVSID